MVRALVDKEDCVSVERTIISDGGRRDQGDEEDQVELDKIPRAVPWPAVRWENLCTSVMPNSSIITSPYCSKLCASSELGFCHSHGVEEYGICEERKAWALEEIDQLMFSSVCTLTDQSLATGWRRILKYKRQAA